MNIRKPLLFLCMAITFSFSCYAQLNASVTITITNTLNIQRTDELIRLKKTAIEKLLQNLPVFLHYEIEYAGARIPTQFLYSNNNYDKWDEIVFLASFKPNEQKTFAIVSRPNIKESVRDTNRAHVRMKLKTSDSSFDTFVSNATMPYQNPPTDFSKTKLPLYLTEGPAWENDKIAFRLYFDTRNTKDIYGKRIPGMVMDTVGANPRNSYHNLSGWGMDILHVVKSLGASSLAIATKSENGKDTLIRLGGKNIIKETFEELEDGPLLARFIMNYQWLINNKPVTIDEEISIWGGQYFYESKVSVTGLPKGAKLVTGIADFYENTVDSFHEKSAAVLLSHGKQSENKDELGLAIMIPQQDFVSFSEAPKKNSDITETHLATQKITKSKPAVFRFYSCWSKTDEHFISRKYFEEFMRQEAQKFSQPLQIEWRKK